MKTLVWDLPLRFFHWGFAASITAAFVVALGVDDDSPLFQLHMLFGLVAVFLLMLRLLLGVFGSRHARFANFPLRPAEIGSYFTGVLTGSARRYVGNNPGSALAALAMFALVPVIVLTGIAPGEAGEELHEIAAYALLAVIAVHLLGLALHTLRHRENIAVTMLTGRKDVPADAGLRSTHPAWGIAFAAATGAWIVALFSSHDAPNRTVRLPLIGTVVQLGENEHGERGGQAESKNEHHRHHHDERDGDDD